MAWLMFGVQPPLDGAAFRKLMDGRLSEAQWQKQVEQMLDLHTWWWLHVPSNVIVCTFCHRKNYRGIKKGLPDILALRPPHRLWLELKTESGALTREQKRVHQMLRACGDVVICARPRHRERLFAILAQPEMVA